MKKITTAILTTCVLFFTMLSAHSSQASDPEIKAEIVKYGLYAVTLDNGKTWINPVSDQKVSSPYPEPIHVKTTTKVPAITPLFFGFEYQLSGLPDGTAEITTQVTHPPIMNESGKASTSYEEQHQYLVLDGKLTGLTGYILESKNELTPGQWKFSIKYQNKELVTHEFTVIED